MRKYLSLAFLVAGVSLLAACGDDDSSSAEETKTSFGTASVPTYDDLAHCTKSHYGEIVFVEEESAYFECTSEDWVEVDESKLDSLLAAASSSSVADEDKPKSSSSLKADSTETADVEKVEVDSITVKGFAQKGPFASGTAVTVYGLDSLLEKTKTKFTGKVSGDSGAFKVEKIVLPSQYALVEVSGYYQNEVTGKKTSGSKTTLSALVDLSEGKTVKANVNLFTDLEYARAKHLVLKEKFNVPAAKKRAMKELLSVFGGKGDDDLTATALSLSDTTSAGKALLFASILLQGELSASKFGILLGGIEEFFGSTGGLDSAEATAAFADWASKVDSTDNFAAIRENVKAMKLVATVPDFESALYAFWTKEYGLGACTDSLESTIEKNSNKHSDNYGAGYACTAKRWHKATALDTELGLCTGKMEGQFKEYKGGKTAEYYVCKVGSWNKITETQFELKECSEKRENEYVKTKSGEYFVCSGKQWIEIDALTYELKLCTEDRNLELVKIDKSGSYVCEWSDGEGAWREATELEAELGVCGTVDNPNETRKEKSGKYYLCYEKWREITALEYEIGACGGDGGIAQDSFVEKKADEHYYCDGKSWATIDSVTYALEKFCTESAGESLDSLEQCSNESCSQTSKVIYGCSSYNDEWKWVRTSYPYRKICSDLHKGDFVEISSRSHYYCQKKEDSFVWMDITPNAYMLKRLCDAEHNLDTVTCKTEECNGKKYYCFNHLGYYNVNEGYNKLSTTAGLRHYGWYDSLPDYEEKKKIATYAITRIGSQLWMAENLRYRYTTGTAPDSGSYCYNDDYNKCKDYGRLYFRDAAMDAASENPARIKYPLYDSPVRGLCPIGWHIPSVSDFEKMLDAIGISIVDGSDYGYGAGYKLNAKTGWKGHYGDDEYGFSAKSTGYAIVANGNMKYYYEAEETRFWSSSTTINSAEEEVEYKFRLYYNRMDKDIGNIYKYALSVRCVKDDD